LIQKTCDDFRFRQTRTFWEVGSCLLGLACPLTLFSATWPTVPLLMNGALIDAAEGKFDVLITADQNLRYQQNLSARQLAIIERPFNSWPRLRQLVPRIVEALNAISAGAYIEIRN
jgi:hypothetical protein